MDDNKIQNNKENLKTVRTYMSDMADTVRANEISVIKVALAEQNKKAREELYRKAEGTPVNKIFWFIGGIILIAGALYGSTFLINKKDKINIPVKIVKEEAMISYDEVSTIILGDSNKLLDKIKNVIKEKSSIDNNSSIKYILILKEVSDVKQKIEPKELFSNLKFTAPSALVRSLSNNYMVGTYTKNSSSDSEPMNQKLFIILQSNDYEFTYAGMLDWEKTLAGDMIDLFELNTTDTKNKLNERIWKDLIINNKDSRVLYNEENKPILYYIFADQNNLIIADNQDTIKEILSKLILKNTKPL
jgi:hypothetical protein